MRRVHRLGSTAIVSTLLIAISAGCTIPYVASETADEKLARAARNGSSGNLRIAVHLATSVIKEQPSNPLAYLVRGTAHRKLGEYSKAVRDMDRSIELNPRLADAYVQRAFARQQDDSADAMDQIIDDANLAIELDPTSSLAFIIRGNAFADLGKHRIAIADFDQALRLNPRSYSALGNRAKSKYVLGHEQEAVRDLKQALRLGPPVAERAQIIEVLARLGEN